MLIVHSQTTPHRLEGGVPTKNVQPCFWGEASIKSVQLPCGSGALAAMNALHTTTHRSISIRCTR
jgi:hypothetical protein